MTERRVHLRYASVYYIGRTKTFCGKTLHGCPDDMTPAVVSFDNLDATVHGTLVTCPRCLPGTRHVKAAGAS